MTNKLSILPHRYRSTPLPLLAASALLFAQACLPPETAEDTPAAQTASALRNDPRLSAAVQRASEHLLQLRPRLGLDEDHSFQARSAVIDELGLVHLRYDQSYRGVRIWEGDVLVQLSANNTPTIITDSLQRDLRLSTRPLLSEAQALQLAHADLRPQGPYASPRTIELVVYPENRDRERPTRLRGPAGELNAEDLERVVDRHTLAYHIHATLENGTLETSHTDYLIDARNGTILKKWSTLFTTAADGTGNSEYSGSVKLGTDSAASGFDLRDVTRTMNITTYNLNNGTSGTGTVYNDADNTWGDGKNFTAGGSTTGDNGQTAGVDAHYGVERTFDYYSNVHGRNGIDGAGLATYSRVHYSTSYDNAFWSDSCFCMTYGDGKMFTVLTSLDVTGHEMTHGVTSRTAKLTYAGESGGLNESMSDINGTMVEFYVRGGSGSTIGNTGGNWLIGDQLTATPLRYMYKPSKDGKSRDAWSSTLGSIDVHYSSGPMNRAFYFLSQGASNVATSDFYSSYLPGGMTGIGNDKAARIAYRALSVKMTASTNYAAARTAFLAAATDLYGATSDEYAAVQNAFAAINVGTPAGGDTVPPTTALTAPTAGATLNGTVTVSASAMDNIGVTKVEFYAGATVIGTVTATPYNLSWNSAAVPNGTYALTSKAYDAAGNTGTSAAVRVTVSNTGTDTVPPTTALTAPTAGATVSGTVTVSATAMDNVGVAKVEFYAGAILLGTDTTAPYSIAWNSTAVANGTYILTSLAYDAAGNAGASAAVRVIVNNGGGTCTSTSQLLANPGFESGNVSWTTTAGVIDNSNVSHAHSGTWAAWMDGYGSKHTDTAYQQVTIPATACSATLSFWLAIQTSEIGTTVYDKLTVTVQDTTGKVLATLGTYSNVNAGAYTQKTFNLAAYKGQTVRIHFNAVEDAGAATSFLIDDTAVNITK